MRMFTKTLLLAVTMGFSAGLSTPALAAGKQKRAAKSGAKAGSGGRERVLSREATQKGKDATKVDFEAADIGGQRKMPLGDTINSNKSDKNYDFVKIRLRWHPEMVQSASALDAGDSQK